MIKSCCQSNEIDKKLIVVHPLALGKLSLRKLCEIAFLGRLLCFFRQLTAEYLTRMHDHLISSARSDSSTTMVDSLSTMGDSIGSNKIV